MQLGATTTKNNNQTNNAIKPLRKSEKFCRLRHPLHILHKQWVMLHCNNFHIWKVPMSQNVLVQQWRKSRQIDQRSHWKQIAPTLRQLVSKSGQDGSKSRLQVPTSILSDSFSDVFSAKVWASWYIWCRNMGRLKVWERQRSWQIWGCSLPGSRGSANVA